MTTQEVDAAIAKLRGWVYCDMSQYWLSPPSFWTDEEDWYTGATCDNDGRISPSWDGKTPPPYCSAWALAGPLFVEIQAGPWPEVALWFQRNAWFVVEEVTDRDACIGITEREDRTYVIGKSCSSPTEAIARAFLNWKSPESAT